MKATLQILYGLVLGAVGLVAALALLLRFNTDPSTAYAFFLFYLTLQWISTLSFRRDMVPRFIVSSILCMAAAFWLLQCNAPLFLPRYEGPHLSAFIARSVVVLMVLLAIPPCASYLASRSLRPLRRVITAIE